jgi:hypothetical protein
MTQSLWVGGNISLLSTLKIQPHFGAHPKGLDDPIFTHLFKIAFPLIFTQLFKISFLLLLFTIVFLALKFCPFLDFSFI